MVTSVVWSPRWYGHLGGMVTSVVSSPRWYGHLGGMVTSVVWSPRSYRSHSHLGHLDILTSSPAHVTSYLPSSLLTR